MRREAWAGGLGQCGSEMLKSYTGVRDPQWGFGNTNLTKCFTHVPGKGWQRRGGPVGISEWVEAFRMFETCSTNLSNCYSNVSFLPVRANYNNAAFKILHLGVPGGWVVRILGFHCSGPSSTLVRELRSQKSRSMAKTSPPPNKTKQGKPKPHKIPNSSNHWTIR